LKRISAETVRADFNDLAAVIHYTRAAHGLGLWASERTLIERFLPGRASPLLEAGCGAGRVTIGLWDAGYHALTAFDFARELLDQAVSLATERHATGITFLHADATDLTRCRFLHGAAGNPRGLTAGARRRHARHDPSGVQAAGGRQRAGRCSLADDTFSGALFLFNGLMQIPGRANRCTALRELRRVCRTGAPLLFTSHDRDHSPAERTLWRLETLRWLRGEQDPRLVEFGDRYFEDEAGRTFMHLPDRREILEDLAASGWHHEFDEMRSNLARESRAVRDFSDECRFWVARK
jgi:SAM-dependent methyltransferase